MLKPNKDRLDYGNLLMPPEGFKLDKAVGTSYSLDLDALVSIPVALYFAHSLDIDLKQDIVQVLDAIRRATASVRVYCQKGQISIPDNQHRLYSFIEPCVIQIPPTQNNSFHPKVWIIRYTNKEAVKYKVIVLSRNLTFDRSMDVAFCLEGDEISDRKNNFRETKPLVDFVKYLAGHEKAAWHDVFIKDLAKTNFELASNEFESFEFFPSGIPGYKNNYLFDDILYDDLLVVSPFLTSSGLEAARRHSKAKPRLFSRELELKKIKPDLLKYFIPYHLSNDYVSGEEKLNTDTEENLSIQYQDLHAKLYSYKNGSDAYLMLGSANCSERAMLRNIEFMISLKGKNSKIGPDAIYNELINEDLDIFQRYNPSNQLSEQEKVVLQEEDALSRLKVELTNAPIKARAIQQEDGNYQVNIQFDLSGIAGVHEIDATASLLNSNNQKHVLTLGSKNEFSFHNISELDLSCFLLLHMKSKHVASGFAIKISITGIPASRNSRIFRAIISNPQNFLKYIRFLLADNFWDEKLSFKDPDPSTGSAGSSFNQFYFYETPIYENMLKAASREPVKLKEIKMVIESIHKEETAESKIIPEDFQLLWNVFENVLQNKS